MKQAMKPTPIPKRISAFLLCFALLVGLLPVTASATETAGAFTIEGGTADTDYSYSNGVLTVNNGANITIKQTGGTDTSTTDRIVVASNATATITLAGVNIVQSSNNSAVDISAGANLTLTLAEETTNTLKGGYNDTSGGAAGIHVPSGASLTINGSGSLSATGGDYAAGIGGGSSGAGGTITINGGTVTATGGDYAAGIGGGFSGAGGNVTINDGTVTATGGNGAAGIGGSSGGAGGVVTINGGVVTAKGGSGGAGIGGGSGALSTVGTVTINNGTVTATGGLNAAGIGSGSAASSNTGSVTIRGGIVTAKGGAAGAGIGGGQVLGNYGGAGCTVVITGGIVTATGGNSAANDNGTGIGAGGGKTNHGSFATSDSEVSQGTAIIYATGGTAGNTPGAAIGDNDDTTGWSGIIFQGNSGTVYGNQTLTGDFEIKSGQTLTIPVGTTLTVGDGTTLTVDGTLTVSGTLNGSGTIAGSGSISPDTAKPSATITNINVSKTTYDGYAVENSQVSYTYTGAATTPTITITWHSASPATDDNKIDAPSDPGTYYVKVSAEATGLYQAASAEHQFTIGPGAPSIQATVYKGETQTSEFTYGDTITIKGTVSVSSPVSTNSLAQNTVGLYVTGNETPIATASVSDGNFELTYDTANKGISIGNQTLTIKYGGRGNLTEGSATVQIKLDPKPVTATVTGTITKAYTGTTDAEVTLGFAEGALLTGDTVTVSAPDAAYVNANVSNSISISLGNLTVEGNDAAWYTVNVPTGVTGSITPAPSTAAAVTGKTDLSYIGSEQELVSVAGTATGGEMYYVVGTDSTTAPDTGWNTEIPKGKDAGTYYVWYYVQGDGNHNDTSAACVAVTIDKATPTPTTPTGLTATYGQTLADVTLPTGWTWNIPNTSVGDVGEWSFPATYTHDTSGNYKTVQQDLTVKVNAAQITGTVSISGEAKFGQQLTASYSGASSSETVSYQWKRDGTEIENATGLTYVLEEADVGKTITVTVQGTGNYRGSKTSDATAPVSKADGSITISCPSVVYGNTPIPTVTNQTGSGTVAYSYSGTGTTTYVPSSEAPTNVGTYTVTATAAETATHTQASAAVTFSITQSGSTLSVSDPGSVAYGGDLTITVTVQDGNNQAITTATGTVTLRIGEATLATADTPTNGVYTLTCKAGRELAIGINTLTVTYTGDSNVGGSDGTASVTLTPKVVSASVNGTPSKTYDAATDITVALAVDGLENGDTLTGTVSGSFANADAGTDKPITLGDNPTWSDTDTAGYYNITLPTGVTGTITKATPTLNLTAAPTALTGGGRVTLTLTGLPDGESATVICGESSIAVTNNNDGTWTTGNLPNQTKDYTFTATFAGSGNYEAATASCQVSVTRRSSGGSTTPSRPSTTEPSTGSSGGWDEIGTEIAEAQPGETIVVDMNGATEVPAEIFEEVAGKDVTVEFDLGGGISWTVNGQDVPTGTSFQSLNLGVDMGTSGISVNVINNITGEYGTVQMTLAHDGEFGFTLTLTAPLGSDNAGHWANLYYYHEDNETLTFQTSGRIGADGSVSLRFSHASQYAIVIDDYDHGAEELPFTDVAESAWYYDAVSYVYTEGLMAGTSGTTFSPDITTSRAMIAVILWRLEGSPATSEYTDFSDVADGVWYAEGVRWASSVGVVGGYPNGSFGPNDPITREQMAAMLYRYADYKGCDVTDLADLSAFTDAEDISGYAVTALRWANAAGIVGGYNDSTLRPQGEARRSEAAAMLQRFCENKAK